MGLIPALDRLFCTTSSQSCETVASDLSSLSGLLSVSQGWSVNRSALAIEERLSC